MIRLFCDICGKEMPEEEKFDNKDNCRKGRFRIEYQRARVDSSNGKVFGFDYPDNHLCDQCRGRLESAVWKELRSMTEEKPEIIGTSRIPAEPVEIRVHREKCCDPTF